MLKASKKCEAEMVAFDALSLVVPCRTQIKAVRQPQTSSKYAGCLLQATTCCSAAYVVAEPQYLALVFVDM